MEGLFCIERVGVVILFCCGALVVLLMVRIGADRVIMPMKSGVNALGCIVNE